MVRSGRRDAASRAALGVLMLVTLLPFGSLLSTALQPPGSAPTGLSWPHDPQWSNFVDAWNMANVTTLMKSSALIVAGVVPVSLLFATMAGFALGQLRIVGSRAVFMFLLLGLTIPLEALVIPLYYQADTLGILNTRWAIILPLIGLSMPFGAFWMRAHFLGIPAEITEAAKLDGASDAQAFRRIHLPLAVPALTTLAILQFLTAWNQFLLAVVLVDDPSKRTMAGALGAFQGQYRTDVVLLCAGTLVLIMPTILVFLVLQRQFLRALLEGAVKG